MHEMVKQQRHVCTLLKLKGVAGLGRYQKVDARPFEVVEESDPQSNKHEQRVSNVAERAPIGTILAGPNGSTRRTHACASVGGLILCLLGSIFGYTFVLPSPWEMEHI